MQKIGLVLPVRPAFILIVGPPVDHQLFALLVAADKLEGDDHPVKVKRSEIRDIAGDKEAAAGVVRIEKGDNTIGARMAGGWAMLLYLHRVRSLIPLRRYNGHILIHVEKVLRFVIERDMVRGVRVFDRTDLLIQTKAGQFVVSRTEAVAGALKIDVGIERHLMRVGRTASPRSHHHQNRRENDQERERH